MTQTCNTNPLSTMQTQAGATFLPFGKQDHEENKAIDIVETFGAYEAEYAAIRKGVGLFDMSHRGLVAVRGADRLSFLHAMVTQDVNDLKLGQVQRGFLLNKLGRITADVNLCHVLEPLEKQGDEDRSAPGLILLETDRSDAAQLVTQLDTYLFGEDVQLTDVSDQYHHLALLGPASGKLLGAVGRPSRPMTGPTPVPPGESGEPGEPGKMGESGDFPGGCGQVFFGDIACYFFGTAETGSPGFHLLVPGDRVTDVYQLLADQLGGLVPQVQGGQPRPWVGRAVGWLAYNTARIEAGSRLYHIDFGPDSLPHETGLLAQAVSFTKGCYLGQEVVARMENLGKPKRVLVGLLCDDQRLPIARCQVLDGQDQATVVGAVTSSALSPMLGQKAIVIAMMAWKKRKPGTLVKVAGEGQLVSATTCQLPFWADP